MIQESNSGIELRSEKTRKLIGNIPSFYLRYGTLIVVFVIIIASVFICLLPYQRIVRYPVAVKENIENTIIASVYFKISEIDKILNCERIELHLKKNVLYVSEVIVGKDQIVVDGEMYVETTLIFQNQRNIQPDLCDKAEILCYMHRTHYFSQYISDCVFP